MNIGELIGNMILLAMFGYYSLLISGILDASGLPKKARHPGTIIKVFVYGSTIMFALRVVWDLYRLLLFD